jgi:hypothetical protein
MTPILVIHVDETFRGFARRRVASTGLRMTEQARVVAAVASATAELQLQARTDHLTR